LRKAFSDNELKILQAFTEQNPAKKRPQTHARFVVEQIRQICSDFGHSRIEKMLTNGVVLK
jgi:hypothetical protein